MRLAIITTHPIQYYAPLFKLLHQRGAIEIKVFYTWGESAMSKYDPGFDKQVDWDIPLLEGYPYEWVENTAAKPGSHHRKGIVTPGLTAQVMAMQPDAVLIFGWAYSSHLQAMRYFKNRIPVYFRGDSTLLDKQNKLKTLLKSLYLKRVYKNIDHAFYTGTNNKAYFKSFGLKDNQLTFAPHAVDNDRFSVVAPDQVTALRSNLNISEQDILILYAGKFEEKKDPMLLVDAFLQLNRANCHLLMAGNGALQSALKQKAKSAANIHFMDFQNQSYMPVLFHTCDLFCLPSKGPGETWGLAVNEAMACGKPVLVSDKVGCAIDLIKPGHNGAIFTSGNERDLLSHLTVLTSSKAQLKSLGENAGATIKNWSFTKITEAIENKLLNE